MHWSPGGAAEDKIKIPIFAFMDKGRSIEYGYSFG